MAIQTNFRANHGVFELTQTVRDIRNVGNARRIVVSGDPSLRPAMTRLTTDAVILDELLSALIFAHGVRMTPQALLRLMRVL